MKSSKPRRLPLSIVVASSTALAAMVMLLPEQIGHAALTVVDQVDTITSGVVYLQSTSVGTGFGESFTPTLPSLNAAAFTLSVGASNTTVTLRLDVFTGTGYTGGLLGSSTPVNVSNTVAATYEFVYATPIVVTPMATYSFRLTETAYSGSGGSNVNTDYTNAYSGGVLLNSSGGTFPSDDLTFAEGIDSTVSEPSTWILLLVGVLIVTRCRCTRRAA